MIRFDTNWFFMRMADHDFVLKNSGSYPVPGMNDESHENIAVRTTSLWTKFLKLRPHEHEAKALNTQSL
jgi:hypothetical protein